MFKSSKIDTNLVKYDLRSFTFLIDFVIISSDSVGGAFNE